MHIYQLYAQIIGLFPRVRSLLSDTRFTGGLLNVHGTDDTFLSGNVDIDKTSKRHYASQRFLTFRQF